MLVSWNWLSDYVKLDMQPSELEQRLAMAGLNHESSHQVGDDLAIDLEVTSNRPDCLGHIGVAREVAVLWELALQIPDAAPQESGSAVNEVTDVNIECPDLCYRYSARVIQGVKVGPSPDWLVDRLHTIGISTVNNIVDITNFVLMECGQPLHAFDFEKLAGPRIIVREAERGEQFQAIDHRTYALEPGMCVIADAKKAVALGGVMGGAETEVSDQTTQLLIESAEFAPISIRNTARRLNLHSPSSYRFERRIDPAGVDWASRRCCDLILEIAGGELAAGVIDVGQPGAPPDPLVLRFDQIPRVLGIKIDRQEIRRILTDLGCREISSDDSIIKIQPPSWRRDLTREIDLIEEAARIHGYHEIPEDVGVPMAPSHRTDEDRVLARVRSIMTSAGFDEAMSCSIVPLQWTSTFSPWTDADPIRSGTPMKGVLGDSSKVASQADRLRRSIIPSLLESRRINESLANTTVELFETAKVYLPSENELPDEPWMLAITSGRDFRFVKGVVENLLSDLHATTRLETKPTEQPLLDQVKSCQLDVDGRVLGYLGEVSESGLSEFNLRAPTTVAEIDLGVLGECANLIPTYRQLSPYPAITRDFNFVVDEQVRWSDLEATVHSAGGDILQSVDYQDTYRDPNQRDGAGKKRLLLSVTMRATDRTLTGEDAEGASDRIVNACSQAHGATLLA